MLQRGNNKNKNRNIKTLQLGCFDAQINNFL